MIQNQVFLLFEGGLYQILQAQNNISYDFVVFWKQNLTSYRRRTGFDLKVSGSDFYKPLYFSFLNQMKVRVLSILTYEYSMTPTV